MEYLSILSILILTLIAKTEQHGDHSRHAHIPRDGPDNKFRDGRVVHDKEHIEEHLREEIGYNSTEGLSDAEAEFYYFKMHDLNNDTRLDGLEILAALTHMLPQEELYAANADEAGGGGPQHASAEELKKAMDRKREEAMKYYTSIIDRVLEDDDKDNDGYLNYLEYVVARRKDEQAGNQ